MTRSFWWRRLCSTHGFRECGQMKMIAFLTDYAVVDRIVDHVMLTFLAERLPPPQVAYQEVLMAAESLAEYFS
ncbi:MAG: hypothetical protein OEY18_05710 [Candidatus Aminicenantes bacterium]|nr:hypothetical protein [Candidatus Aminicenantes bacterium]MDH5384186.1 hypothetical protein [Candidatus Aminicenantes bacterium]